MEPTVRSAVVVDDDSQIRYFVQLVLANAGYSVRVATDGEDALEKLGSQSAELLVTDLMMPKMDGIELIRSVRDSGMAATIIAMSGAIESVCHSVANRLGADYMLQKPFTIGELERLLAEIATVGPPGCSNDLTTS